jgi:Mn2+/Fe2+ NRAMP family transporter
VFASLLLVPIVVMVHPAPGQIAHDFFVPQIPKDSKLSDVMLLIIGIVGTTVAPWQLFFQQSYVIDKRITPRFIRYQKMDLWLGIVMVVVGAVAMISFTAGTFAGQTEFGNFTDAAGVAGGLEKYFGRVPGVFFAIALIDASIIGALAVSLSTAYAIGDVFAVRHSLHRKPSDAKAFYAVYVGLIIVAAALVLTPGTPLGLLTNLVQTLAGVLLPSATVFLLLLCNDKAVLGPWVNSKGLNWFTAAIIAVLVMLSVILTAAVLFPDISDAHIIGVLIGGTLFGAALAFGVKLYERHKGMKVFHAEATPLSQEERDSWRMPATNTLAPARLSLSSRMWMLVLRGYLVIAAGLLIVKLVVLAVAN